MTGSVDGLLSFSLPPWLLLLLDLDIRREGGLGAGDRDGGMGGV